MYRDQGWVGAALTPRGKRGELNFGACFELIDHLCKAKAPGIALLTAAGEYPAFTLEERTRLVYLGTKRSRAPVLAGVGAEDLETAVALGREAIAAGAQGLVLPPPLLFAYPKEELREYYLAFAGQVGRGTEIWIDGVPAPGLMESGKFAGVVGEGLRLAPEACAVPELWTALACARRTGDPARATALEMMLEQFENWAGQFAPLVAVKVATGMRGISVGALPVPVAPERAGLLEEFRSWFTNWLPVVKKTVGNG